LTVQRGWEYKKKREDIRADIHYVLTIQDHKLQNIRKHYVP